MYKTTILNALSNQSYPIKCQILNTILEECTSKELCSTFELIVTCIFSDSIRINHTYSDFSDINNNSNLNRTSLEQKLTWPLKLVNRSQYGIEYDCMFNFLNTSSLFWLSMFRLDNLGASFTIECGSLPLNVRHRIESSLSHLASKVDAFNFLTVNALEFYMIHFLLLLHDSKTNSRRLYNDQYGNIELDSVYADLLNDYLNYFLPLNERDVNFPNFIDVNQPKQQATLNPIPAHHRHHSLLKRVVQKSLSEDNNLTMISEPDRVSDMVKIDLFLRLLIELLVNSFTDSLENMTSTFSSSTSSNTMMNKFGSPPAQPKSILSNLTKNLSLSNSPVKLNDPKQYLANIETVFALSMIVKHFHIFSNAFSLTTQLPPKMNDWSQLNETRRSPKLVSQTESPLDELRALLFRNYLRKPFYKLFQFHFEHWPLTPSIKWIIELWFTYIQPWKFFHLNNQSKSLSLTSEFIKENFLLYSDIYQLILKRFCIFDLTNEENINTLHRILYIFYSQSQVINKIDYLFLNVQSYLKQLSNQECEVILRQNPEYRFVLNLLNESEKPLYSYKPLNGIEHLKLVSSFYESLVNTKNVLKCQIELKSAPKGNFVTNLIKSLFSSDQDKQFSTRSKDDFVRIVVNIDECINLFQEFYKSHPFLNETFELFNQPTTSTAESSMNGSYLQEAKPRRQSNGQIKPECELTNRGLRLSPRGRYQIINRLAKPVITNNYDPDTAPVGEFENKFIVCLLNEISYWINKNYSNQFEKLYNRDDLIGKISRKYLYGPNELKSKVSLVNNQMKSILDRQLTTSTDMNDTNMFRVRLSLRSLANYKFIFYFLLNILIFKAISGYSFIITFILVSLMFLILNLFK